MDLPATRSPLTIDLDAAGQSLVRAERGFESHQPAKEDNEILQRAMVLLADRALTLFDQRARGLHIGDVLDQKTPESFARRIEPWGIVETTEQREELVQRDVH